MFDSEFLRLVQSAYGRIAADGRKNQARYFSSCLPCRDTFHDVIVCTGQRQHSNIWSSHSPDRERRKRTRGVWLEENISISVKKRMEDAGESRGVEISDRGERTKERKTKARVCARASVGQPSAISRSVMTRRNSIPGRIHSSLSFSLSLSLPRSALSHQTDWEQGE